MEFTKNHSQEMADIKASAHEMDRSVRECLKQLERIRRSQDEALGNVRNGPESSQDDALAGVRKARKSNGQTTPDAVLASNTSASGPLLAFVHIPKTAGGSVTSMLT